MPALIIRAENKQNKNKQKQNKPRIMHISTRTHHIYHQALQTRMQFSLTYHRMRVPRWQFNWSSLVINYAKWLAERWHWNEKKAKNTAPTLKIWKLSLETIFRFLRAWLHGEFQPGLKFRSAHRHRAEILLRLHAQFQAGWKTQISMRKFTDVRKHSRCSC